MILRIWDPFLGLIPKSVGADVNPMVSDKNVGLDLGVKFYFRVQSWVSVKITGRWWLDHYSFEWYASGIHVIFMGLTTMTE